MPILLRTWQGVKAQGAKEGKDNGGGGKKNTPQDKKGEPPAPTPAKREDVVFDVTDKTLQKVGAGFCLGVFSRGRGDWLFPLPLYEYRDDIVGGLSWWASLRIS